MKSNCTYRQFRHCSANSAEDGDEEHRKSFEHGSLLSKLAAGRLGKHVRNDETSRSYDLRTSSRYVVFWGASRAQDCMSSSTVPDQTKSPFVRICEEDGAMKLPISRGTVGPIL